VLPLLRDAVRQPAFQSPQISALIRRLRPDAVLALGTAVAVPLFAAAKLLRVRCVFIETVTRVQRLSRTGRLLHRWCLSDRLYVQWPKLADAYPGSRFAGAVL
jgi:UDP-N-acetylglucosamine:LPS N-acetylglucosamine transferase